MRLPTKPEALETNGGPAEPISRDPSYPDRARLDSDVRSFLRPASSPWIVFDRDSRVDDFALSALRVGAVFASSPNLRPDLDPNASKIGATILEKDGVLTSAPSELSLTPNPGVFTEPFGGPPLPLTAASSPAPPPRMFPESPAVPETVLEPSTVVVATDVAPPEPPREPMSSSVVLPPGLLRPRRQVAWVAAACVAVVVLAGGIALGARPAKRARAAAPPATQVAAALVAPSQLPTAAAEAAPAGADTAATTAPGERELAAPAPAIELDEAAPAAAAPAPTTEAAPTDPKKRFGKLTIKADGKVKNVWFDGKRMLGTGTRSFLVFCGMHTVAVNEKIENKDIEIPCNGEYVVSK